MGTHRIKISVIKDVNPFKTRSITKYYVKCLCIQAFWLATYCSTCRL